jgi:hypothetical protein
MGRNFVRGSDPGQGFLLSADVRKWLPGRHLAREMLR